MHPDLLGLPLASHPRRVGAILLDLLLIAVLTNAGGVFLGVVLAVLFFRLALRKGADASTSLPATAMRGTVGCMGGLVLLVTVLTAWSGIQSLFRAGEPDPPEVELSEVLSRPGMGEFLAGLREVEGYRRADSPEEAAELARALADRFRAMGLQDADIRDALREMAPEDADWRDEVDAWSLAPEPDPGPEPSDSPAAADTLPSEEEERRARLAQALVEYAELLEEQGPGAEDSQAAGELRGVILDAVAEDTLAALEARLSAARRERQRAERALVEVASREEESGGVMGWLRSMAEDLGLGLGWGAVYFSVFLTWWGGRTPGKKLFGLRVLRLDGQRMTWWASFERYGGYAAGFATGLLGFAQVYWDPNRQAIHDRIVGTVVVLDKRPPLPVRPVDPDEVLDEQVQSSQEQM